MNILDTTHQYDTLDCLFVPGGEGPARTRSNKAMEIYRIARRLRAEELPIILAGKQSGFCKEDLPVRESEQMCQHLLDQGIPKQEILMEQQSLDTIANFYYGWRFVDGLEARRVGIVTDAFHMARAMMIGAKVLGPDISLVPCPTEHRGTASDRLVEAVMRYAIMFDMRGIEAGNREQLSDFMVYQHPFHAPLHGNKPPLGLYKAGIDLFRLLKR